MGLLEFTDRGIYCPAAGVYLDPWKPVEKALITHGHSDHARFGSAHYLCTRSAAPVIRQRLPDHHIETIDYGEEVVINGVRFSFHPAGHIPGSAQIRVEHAGEVWVFTGDYKLENDGLSEPFELLKCHAFITESTFGLPVYKWKSQRDVFDEINDWWRQNQAAGKVSVIAGYTLGKAQRILKNLDHSIGKVFTHGAVENVNTTLRRQGFDLPATSYAAPDLKRTAFEGALVICPPAATGSPWLRKFHPFSLAIASGWMSLRGTRRRRGADRGFVLSDHADWDGLNSTIGDTGAEKVFVTHGYTEIFSAWLKDQGLDAREVRTQYEGELAEMAEGGDVAEP